MGGELQARHPVPVGGRGVVIADMEGLARFASMVAKSGLAPKGMETPEKIGVAIQLGLELGLSPMSALQNIGVINGRPGVYGDAAKALVEESGLMEEFDEWFEVAGKRVEELPEKIPDGARAVCYSRRRGRKNGRTTPFSVADAKRASLWGKAGPWTQYPGRMLMFRARGFNLRDNFPDVLKGFKTVEELRDYPGEPRPGPAARVSAEATEPPAAGRGRRVTPPQLEALSAQLERTGLSAEEFLALLEPHGADGAGRLTERQAAEVLEYLASLPDGDPDAAAERQAVSAETA